MREKRIPKISRRQVKPNQGGRGSVQRHRRIPPPPPPRVRPPPVPPREDIYPKAPIRKRPKKRTHKKSSKKRGKEATMDERAKNIRTSREKELQEMINADMGRMREIGRQTAGARSRIDPRSFQQHAPSLRATPRKRPKKRTPKKSSKKRGTEIKEAYPALLRKMEKEFQERLNRRRTRKSSRKK